MGLSRLRAALRAEEADGRHLVALFTDPCHRDPLAIGSKAIAGAVDQSGKAAAKPYGWEPPDNASLRHLDAGPTRTRTSAWHLSWVTKPATLLSLVKSLSGARGEDSGHKEPLVTEGTLL